MTFSFVHCAFHNFSKDATSPAEVADVDMAMPRVVKGSEQTICSTVHVWPLKQFTTGYNSLQQFATVYRYQIIWELSRFCQQGARPCQVFLRKALKTAATCSIVFKCSTRSCAHFHSAILQMRPMHPLKVLSRYFKHMFHGNGKGSCKPMHLHGHFCAQMSLQHSFGDTELPSCPRRISYPRHSFQPRKLDHSCSPALLWACEPRMFQARLSTLPARQQNVVVSLSGGESQNSNWTHK